MLTTALIGDQKVSIAEYKKSDLIPYCPLGHRLVGKKGKKVVHHFAHYPGEKCDPWRDGMTHWHSQWQKIVLDKMNLEVCLDINGQILGNSAFQGHATVAQSASHIADIIRPSSPELGLRPLVIEVQHSSIGKDKIDSREQYYQRMIWLFDFTPRLVTAEKCNRIVFVDGRLSYLKDKVTYVAMISSSQGLFMAPPRQASPAATVVKNFDQTGPLIPNSNQDRPDLSMASVTRTQGQAVYCKGDECQEEALTPVSGFFMIISSRTKYWLDTTKPTYFDCGFGILRFLLKLNHNFILVQYLSYEDFIQERMPPINLEKYNGADWFKTISPALLIKLGMIPRIIDVAKIQLSKTKVIFHHKGSELQDMGLEQGMDDWHAGSFYVNSSNTSSTILPPSFSNPLAPSSSNDLMTMMLRQATSGAVAHVSSAAINNEAMSIVKLRRFLGISAAVEIKIINRKGGDWVILYCNNETFNLKDKLKALEMTYHKAAVDKVSTRQSLKNTHSVIQSVVTGVPLSKPAKPAAAKSAKEDLYDKETRAHYRGRVKIIEARLATAGL